MPSIALVTRTPEANAINVSPATEVFVALATTGLSGLDLFYVNIDGVRAFTYDSGISVLANPNFSVVIVPRRRFDVGDNLTLHIHAEKTSGILYTLDTSSAFSIQERTVALLDPTLRQTRVDRPFSITTALEVFRKQLLSAIRPRSSTGSFVVQLFHAVYFSQLRSMSMLFDLPRSINKEVLRVPPEDTASLMAASLVLEQIEVLWLAVLSELAELNVTPLTIQLLSRAHDSASPQERVAAACAAVLLCAKQLTLAENPVTYP